MNVDDSLIAKSIPPEDLNDKGEEGKDFFGDDNMLAQMKKEEEEANDMQGGGGDDDNDEAGED